MANKVILIGNVGKDDPEIKNFDWGKVATFSLATTDRGFTTKDGREVPSTTEWHNIVVKGGVVSVVEKYVKKGTKLYVDGKIKYRTYEKDGAKRTTTEIHVDNIELLDSRGESKQSSPQATVEPQVQYQAPKPAPIVNGNGELPF